MEKITLEEAVEQIEEIRKQLKVLLKELKAYKDSEQKLETPVKTGVMYYSPNTRACDKCPYGFKGWNGRAICCTLTGGNKKPFGCMGELFRHNM